MDAVRADFPRRFRLPRVLGVREALSFAVHALPFFVAAGAYELLRSLTALRGDVHVGDLYALEAALFSIPTASGAQALSEVIARAPHPLLDVVCGATYLLFLVEFFGFAAYLFFRDRRRMLQVSLGFLVLNVFGWAIWMLYPAAPPWYVDLYGTGPAVLDAASSAAGLVRLDELLGVPIAASLYTKSANVFGAMPSLHVGYAVYVALAAWPLGGWFRRGSVAYAFSMAFSAMYLRHHYLLDVLAGAALAVVAHRLVVALTRVVRYEARA